MKLVGKGKKTLVLHGNGSDKDYMSIDSCDRYLLELDDDSKGGKGGNSFVFQAIDPNETGKDLVIKFCRFCVPGNTGGNRKFNTFHKTMQAEHYTRPFSGRLERWEPPKLAETIRIAALVEQHWANPS